MSEKTTLKHGEAKVQYYACRDRVNQLQDAGYSIQAIYDKLVKDGIITMSYKALHCNIRKDRPSARQNENTSIRGATAKPQPVSPPNNFPVSLPGIVQKAARQSLEWSLDEKLAAINSCANPNERKGQGSNLEIEDFEESEIL